MAGWVRPRPSVDEHKRAQYWDDRADTAGRYEEFRKNVPTTLRRIGKLETGQRRIHRKIAELDEELTYRRA